MRKTNCIIADDEALARDVLLSHIGKLNRLHVAATCANGLEVYSALKSTPADLLFLDIEMPHLTGLELLRTLKNPPAVIITTAYREFALEGYELNVIDYLLKPISFERFLKAVDKYETWVNPSHVATSPVSLLDTTSFTEGFIYVKSAKKMVRIVLRDILYLEGLKDYLRIHTTTSQIITYQTLTDFEEKLPAHQFMRVHRSYLVSLAHISSFSALELTVATVTIPIGSTYAREVSRKLNASGII